MATASTATAVGAALRAGRTVGGETGAGLGVLRWAVGGGGAIDDGVAVGAVQQARATQWAARETRWAADDTMGRG